MLANSLFLVKTCSLVHHCIICLKYLLLITIMCIRLFSYGSPVVIRCIGFGWVWVGLGRGLWKRTHGQQYSETDSGNNIASLYSVRARRRDTLDRLSVCLSVYLGMQTHALAAEWVAVIAVCCLVSPSTTAYIMTIGRSWLINIIDWLLNQWTNQWMDEWMNEWMNACRTELLMPVAHYNVMTL